MSISSFIWMKTWIFSERIAKVLRQQAFIHWYIKHRTWRSLKWHKGRICNLWNSGAVWIFHFEKVHDTRIFNRLHCFALTVILVNKSSITSYLHDIGQNCAYKWTYLSLWMFIDIFIVVIKTKFMTFKFFSSIHYICAWHASAAISVYVFCILTECSVSFI